MHTKIHKSWLQYQPKLLGVTKIIPPAQIPSGSSSFIALILYLPFGNRTSQMIHLTLLYVRLVPSSFHNWHSNHRNFVFCCPNILFPKLQPLCVPAVAISTFIFKNCCSNLRNAYLQRPGNLQSEGLYMPLYFTKTYITSWGIYSINQALLFFIRIYFLSLQRAPLQISACFWD